MTERWGGSIASLGTKNIPRITVLGVAYLHIANQSNSVNSNTPVKPITEKEPGTMRFQGWMASVDIVGPTLYTSTCPFLTGLSNPWKSLARGSLDESERGEWKSWLKAQHSEN